MYDRARLVLFRMTNVSHNNRNENQNTHFMFSNSFFENHTVRGTMRKITVEPNRPQMTTRRMYNARWITKATNTHLEYVTLTAFPLQKWLRDRA
jgi:hypothetical protein